MRTGLRMFAVIVIAALALAALVGCGGSSGTAAPKSTSAATSASGAGSTSGTVDDSATFGGTKFSTEAVAQKVNVLTDATGQFKWDKSEYSATAGDVTFVVKNPSAIEHEFSVDGNGINYTSPTLKPGVTNNYTIKGLKAGEYRIVCKVAGHEQLGMVAKLVVK